MKSLMRLLSKVLQDCSIMCTTPTTRDFITISRRVKDEGLSFLTISLGNYAEDFERGLEQGYIDSTAFTGFVKDGPIPRLLGGMVSQVFDTNGVLLNEPSIRAISCIRQVCRMWKKIALPCSGRRINAALEKYVENERDLLLLHSTEEFAEHLTLFGNIADVLWGSVLSKIENKLISEKAVPQHGPGAVQLKVLPNQKYNWSIWHSRLEPYFPSDSFCYNNVTAFLEESSSISYASLDQEAPVRVITVPKTQKTPRIIAIEPACMQYTQQAILDILVDTLEKNGPFKGHINFRDQSINAKLALKASMFGDYATIDLSDASDRVSKVLVERMLQSAPILLGSVMACRSQRAKLPSGIDIQLEKFASMGSALCFPIESMVFFTILIMSEYMRHNTRLSQSSIRRYAKKLYVYGDDLILPTDGVLSAINHLEKFGLKVNARKSFWNGKFRESCGLDAYDGNTVNTVFLRNLLPSSGKQLSRVVSTVAFANDMFAKGYQRTAQYARDVVNEYYDIPVLSLVGTSPCIHFKWYWALEPEPRNVRWNEKLQRQEIYGFVIVPRRQKDQITGNQALMKWFLKGLSPDKKHYTTTVGRGDLTLKRRWCPINW